VLPLLLNAVAMSEESYALVLDDFHLLRDPLVHQSVEFLLTYLTPGLRLVIASREDPPLPLARLRARGKLTEIRVAELRCTSAEGVELLAGVGGMPQMPAGTGEALVQRTEGWPAGLQLAAIALRDSEDPDASRRVFVVMDDISWTTSRLRSSLGSADGNASSWCGVLCWSGCPARCVMPCCSRLTQATSSRSSNGPATSCRH
jgi:hypothetical protein